eukprot:scaffold28493_cov66-Phaeocystis_antarctica.AAC.4
MVAACSRLSLTLTTDPDPNPNPEPNLQQAVAQLRSRGSPASIGWRRQPVPPLLPKAGASTLPIQPGGRALRSATDTSYRVVRGNLNPHPHPKQRPLRALSSASNTSSRESGLESVDIRGASCRTARAGGAVRRAPSAGAARGAGCSASTGCQSRRQ